MAKYKTLDDFDVKNKVVLVRVDFNSEIDPVTKKVTSDVRIKAHAETTLKELAEKGAKTVVLAHQGRKGDPDYTPLKQHAEILQKILKCPVKYVDDVFRRKSQSRHQKSSSRRNPGSWRTCVQLGWRNQKRHTRTTKQNRTSTESCTSGRFVC